MGNTSLVLVSGLLCNEGVWAHQIENLGRFASIQVICPSQNTPQKMVEEILTQAPNKFALAGHSMGGWLCLEVMRKAPEKVERLCLLNTTAKPDSAAKKAKRQEMIERVKNGQFLEIVDELTDAFVFDTNLKDEVKKMLESVGPKLFIQQESSMLLRDECLSILPKITCPTLVIHSDKDKVFTLQDHEELASQIAGAKLSIVENCGHMSPMEKPLVVTELLKSWLN